MTVYHGMSFKGIRAWNGRVQRSTFSTQIGDQRHASPSLFSHLSLFVRLAAGAYVLQLYVANCTLVGWAIERFHSLNS